MVELVSRKKSSYGSRTRMTRMKVYRVTLPRSLKSHESGKLQRTTIHLIGRTKKGTNFEKILGDTGFVNRSAI